MATIRRNLLRPWEKSGVGYLKIVVGAFYGTCVKKSQVGIIDIQVELDIDLYFCFHTAWKKPFQEAHPPRFTSSF